MNSPRPQMRNRFTTGAIFNKAEETVEEMIARGSMLAEQNVPTFIPALRTAVTKILPGHHALASIDKYWRVYWNPEGVKWLIRAAEAISVKNPCLTCGATSHNRYAYLAGLWVHEVGHNLADHHTRYEAGLYTDRDKWNVATDMEMNDDIPIMGNQAAKFAEDRRRTDPLQLSCPAMCLPAYMEVLEEDLMVWDMFGEKALAPRTFWDVFHPVGLGPANAKRQPFGMFPMNCPDGQGNFIKLDDNKMAETYYDLIPDPPKNPNGSGKSKGQSEKNDHGSGVDGEERPWEDAAPNDGGGMGVSAAEASAVRREVAARIKAAANGRGSMPVGWQVWADTQLQAPKVRWEDRMRAMARQAILRVRGDRHNTFRRLARSSIVSNCAVIKPSTYDVVPNVYIVVDTSGSMGSGSRSRLERALSECESIVKSQRVKSFFIDCDAAVYGQAQEVKSVRTARVNGGGGTDMRIGVRAALKSKIKPDLIILLTDGDTPWPEPADVVNCRIITGICNERDMLSRVPAHMNPIWVDV